MNDFLNEFKSLGFFKIFAHMSFPRRRESSKRAIPIDSRLRGNDRMRGLKSLRQSLFFALFLLFSTNAVSAEEEKDVIRKTLRFADANADNWLEIDNIHGSINVRGHSGDEVLVVVNRTIWGRSADKIEEAKEEIVLDVYERNDDITLFVDAPYRAPDGSINYRGSGRYGYKVTMDFEVTVPFGVNIELKTINDGEISVRNVRGDFKIKNVNGGVEMDGLSGSGKVYALNGEVKVAFDENPSKKSYFGSLNGDVEVTFRSRLSSDLFFKTFNGQVYTDFDFSKLPMRSKEKRRRDGKKMIYSSNKQFGVRIENGGPELEFDAFNGNIYVLKKN